MANNIAIQLAHPAPFAARLSQIGTGGSGWTGANSFLVVGWLTPSETDFVNCAAFNKVASEHGSAAATVIIFEQKLWNSAPVATATLTVSWSLPKQRFHHISVYRQAGSSFNPLATSNKLQPSGSDLIDGNIPGYATTADFISPSGMSQEINVPVLATDATLETVTLPGNRIVSFGAGVTFVLTTGHAHDGTHTVATARVSYTNDGVITTVTVTGNITDTTTDTGIVDYNVGPGMFDWPPGQLTLAPVGDVIRRARVNSSRTGAGVLMPRRPGQARHTDRLDFAVDFSAFTSATDGSLFQLLRFAAQGNYVKLAVAADAAVVERRAQTWHGHLVDINELGLRDMQENDAIRFGLLVDRENTIDHDWGWFAIRAVDTGAETFSIDGDWTSEFVAGRAFRVKDSTGNDAIWAVTSSAYNSGTNRSAITVTGNISDATADGNIELYNW